MRDNLSLPQIQSILRERSLVDAERDHSLLHLLHATGLEKGPPKQNFDSVASRLKNFFAPIDPRAKARAMFAAFKARAK